ncbi:MAG: hypothetical protein A3F72_16760 [Bacteroidetes bacterium RIFCSPLOWO2_12_FULL_35_15]|nr:MAG: hypothetical protein A3F72_16760 [Bacteroidetes bacterium RIFCSPLOWO2_12_FULL_35_15]
MNKKASATDDFDSLNVIYFIYQWWKQLTIVCLSAIVISSIVALTISDRYKSTVVLFPATTNSISNVLLSEVNTSKEDLLKFGEEEDAEQMIQILNSNEIRSRICEKYNLMKHYGINPNDKLKNTQLYDIYADNISFKLTEYMSVKIDVLDNDPKLAAEIANDIANLLDSVKIKIQHERALEALKIVERAYLNKKEDLETLNDSLKIINAHGIYDYESQSDRTVQEYNIAIAKGDQRAIKLLEEKLQIIAKYGSEYVLIRDNIILQGKVLSILKTKLEEAKVNANQVLSQKFVVSKAFPAEKKTYPVRWLIVLLSTLSTLFITLIIIIIFGKINKPEAK